MGEVVKGSCERSTRETCEELFDLDEVIRLSEVRREFAVFKGVLKERMQKHYGKFDLFSFLAEEKLNKYKQNMPVVVDLFFEELLRNLEGGGIPEFDRDKFEKLFWEKLKQANFSEEEAEKPGFFIKIAVPVAKNFVNFFEEGNEDYDWFKGEYERIRTQFYGGNKKR